MKKKILSSLMITALTVSMISGCGTGSDSSKDSNGNSEEPITLSLLVDQNWLDSYGTALEAVSDAALEKYNIQIELENKTNGSDGDNTVKTRLAAGEMTDLLIFNSGAQLMSLNPTEYFQDLSEYDFMDSVNETFKKAVSADGKVYGVPVSSSNVGGIIYNKGVYEELNLSVPKTWDEFMDNCEKCKQAGYDAVLQTCGDPWSAQYTVLADYYNVEQEYPDFAKNFEAGTAKNATTDVALRSWEKLSDLRPYINDDYMATTVTDGFDKMGEDGGPVHYIMTSQFFSYMAQLGYDPNLFGMFPIPGDDANVSGYTTWMPNGMYVNRNSENLEAAIQFLEFYISEEGMDIIKENAMADGPYLIEGIELPEDSYQAILDLQPYFDEGKTGLALEFETQLKGASCDQICVECLSGSMTAQEAAQVYDEDCEKMAVQLGLEGWK